MLTHKATGLQEWKLYNNGQEIDTVYGSYEDMLKARQEWVKHFQSEKKEWLNDWPRCDKCGLLHPGECK